MAQVLCFGLRVADLCLVMYQGVASGPGCSGLRFAPALLRRAKPLPSLTQKRHYPFSVRYFFIKPSNSDLIGVSATSKQKIVLIISGELSAAKIANHNASSNS